MVGLLQPHPWQLGEPPPPLPQSTAPPLLLLIDCHKPCPESELEALFASLSPLERQRHSSYRRPADRDRFLMARASLRELLGSWLALSPASIPIAISRTGKPHCPSPGAPAFNLSHSGDLILLGFHGSLAVGVDVEQARPELDWCPIARRVLTPAEVAALQALPLTDQPSAFLAAWCLLEARLKAQGAGLAGLEELRKSHPSFDVAPPGSLWMVAVPPGYAAAAALCNPFPFTVPRVAVAGAARPSLPASGAPLAGSSPSVVQRRGG
ncbi:MAG: 4'-phosphopantetheinyl transferase family protein [Cyanobacteriota bacterium]|jgi:4'-phosphopantetheinyl transferase